MRTFGGTVADSRQVSTAGDAAIAGYDARFALVRDRLIRICAGFVGADAAEDIVHDALCSPEEMDAGA